MEAASAAYPGLNTLPAAGERHQQGFLRDLVEADSTEVGGRGKSGKVTDHPSAHRKDASGPVKASSCEKVTTALELAETLGGFTGWQHQHWQFTEGRLKESRLRTGNVVVGDDRHFAAIFEVAGGALSQLPGQVAPDMNRIRPCPKGDFQCFQYHLLVLQAK